MNKESEGSTPREKGKVQARARDASAGVAKRSKVQSLHEATD